MLKRANRLHLERDIARVRTKGSSRRGQLFNLRYFIVAGAETSRVAFVVSKKISKKAVERNKVARWSREAAQKLLPSFVVSVDIVLSAQQPFAKYSFLGCEKEIEKLLKDATLISNGK
ncbi:MAG: ribonuclease P protein component [bacterium]|nr:ribonuclease P protein component [bacterium]